MGSNIHVHIEVKKAGQWHHFGQPNMRRDYYLYAVIAGERLESVQKNIGKTIRPVAHTHTIPSDISLVTRISLEQDRCGYALYNEGVLTAEDLLLLQDRLYEYNPAVQRTGCDELDLEESVFNTYINGNTLAQHQGWDDLRIVFWFTN